VRIELTTGSPIDEASTRMGSAVGRQIHLSRRLDLLHPGFRVGDMAASLLATTYRVVDRPRPDTVRPVWRSISSMVAHRHLLALLDEAAFSIVGGTKS